MLELVVVFFSLVVIHYKFRDTMVDLLQNLQGVYNKWEEKGRPTIWLPAGGDDDATRKGRVADDEGGGGGLPGTGVKEKNAVVTSSNGGGVVRPWSQGEQPHRVLHNLRSSRHHQQRRTDRNVTPLEDIPQQSTAVDTSKPQQPVSILPKMMSGLRPFMGTCCLKCLPGSRKSFVDDTVVLLGMHNLLLVPEMNEGNSYIVRRFHYLTHVLRTRGKFLYPEVTPQVLGCERVMDAVQKAAVEDMDDNDLPSEAYSAQLRKHAHRARTLLKIMGASLSSVLIRLVSYTVYKVLSRLLTSVEIHKGQIEVLKRASKKSYPLIFLPTHRSHLDYILVTFILYNNEIKAPLVAAGDNLRIPILGTLLRGLGAFFIKRKLDPKTGKKDHVYRALLHTYMEKCLAEGHSLEFFIEGGRSRTGKMYIPKAGLLSIVMDAYMDGVIPDAYVCPVSINYDKLMDGNFISEQLGNPKVMESLWSTMKAMWRLGNTNYGSVRVDFLQPFSLKEFVQSAQMYTVAPPRPLCAPSPSSPPHVLRRLSSSTSLYGTDVVKEGYRHLVKILAEHISYDLSNATALMSTNLLAFLLLCKFRKGATVQQAVHGITWLKEELRMRGRDVAFSGDVTAVVEHAVNLLGSDLVERQVVPTESATDESSAQLVVLKPASELPYVIELSYYSNAVLSVFLMDSVVANAICAVADDDLVTLRACNSRLTISRLQLVDKVETLCDILQFDFIFVPPCTDLNSVIGDAVERFFTKDILSNIVSTTDSDVKNKFDESRPSDSESEDEGFFYDPELKVNLTEENVEQLEFYRGILSPLIESYWLVACNLSLLVQTQMEESEFLKQTRLNICNRIAAALVTHNESVSGETIRNAIKLFENWKVVESSTHGRVKLLSLADEFNQVEQLSDIVASIEEFKK